jgi:myo-inositol catabolism protein IolC
VQEWLKVGAKINGIIGFAVGRTIFWEPLAEFRAGRLSEPKAIEGIAGNYLGFVDLWRSERKKK